jgi:hypothetical protein
MSAHPGRLVDDSHHIVLVHHIDMKRSIPRGLEAALGASLHSDMVDSNLYERVDAALAAVDEHRSLAHSFLGSGGAGETLRIK